MTTDLRHSITSKDTEGNPMYIEIRLNDECKNGHQDFAITCSIYQKGKPKIDRYFIAGGCCHEEIIKARPDLKIFVDLHLCDWEGIPMYAVENGFYHLRNGFNNIKPDDNDFKDEFCEYYRVDYCQFDELNKCRNQLQYAIKLKEIGILDQWKRQANTAIKLLEEMTGETFKPESEKSQYHAPTPEEMNEESKRVESGYYTAEAEDQREEERRAELLSKLIVERDSDIANINTEFEIKKQVLEIGGELALDNCLYYTHSKTIAFNWKGYSRISNSLIAKLRNGLILPKGVTFENQNK